MLSTKSSWAPAPYRSRAVLAQSQPRNGGFLASKGVALATDFAALGVSGILTYSMYKDRKQTWGTFWLLATTAVAAKTLHDFGQPIDHPASQLVTDIAATVSMGTLGYVFGRTRSRWSTVFWALASVTAFKGIVDLSRLYR